MKVIKHCNVIISHVEIPMYSTAANILNATSRIVKTLTCDLLDAGEVDPYCIASVPGKVTYDNIIVQGNLELYKKIPELFADGKCYYGVLPMEQLTEDTFKCGIDYYVDKLQILVK